MSVSADIMKNYNCGSRSSYFSLSICILSYEQPEEMRRLLDSLVSQWTPDIEVIMRDDSLHDETYYLVKEYQKKIPIRYIRGKREGIDNTIIFLTEEAKGEYVWWIGDDTIAPWGVSKVLEVIQKFPTVNFIWANYLLSGTQKYGVDLCVDSGIVDKNLLLYHARAGLGFISSTIFKRNLGMQSLAQAQKFVGTEFSNLYIVLHVITRPGSIYNLQGPIVICHPADSNEIRRRVNKPDGQITNNSFNVFAINFSKILNNFSVFFNRNVVNDVLRKNFSSVWRGMIVGYVGGWDVLEGKRIPMIRNFGMYFGCWVFILLSFIPRNILSYMYSIYQRYHSRGKTDNVR